MAAAVGEQYKTEARREWAQARRKARMAQYTVHIPGEKAGLHDFNEISDRLNLKHAIYRGVQNVPLDQIVGSVGRYQDFTGAFLPVDNGLQYRWEKIAALYLDPTSGGAPPIELYKIGSSYFVKDGNHRVSVARQLDMADIEAYVWEYQEPVDNISPEDDIDTILLEAGRQQFLEKTGLDDLRPGHNIRLTAPGGYVRMLVEIVRYQEVLSHIDNEQVSWEDTVTAWYDMIYETTVQLIEAEGVLDLFPDRTPADFFVWVRKHQQELEERYDRPVMVGDAARDFGRRNRQTIPGRVIRWVLRWVVGHMDM